MDAPNTMSDYLVLGLQFTVGVSVGLALVQLIHTGGLVHDNVFVCWHGFRAQRR